MSKFLCTSNTYILCENQKIKLSRWLKPQTRVLQTRILILVWSTLRGILVECTSVCFNTEIHILLFGAGAGVAPGTPKSRHLGPFSRHPSRHNFFRPLPGPRRPHFWALRVPSAPRQVPNFSWGRPGPRGAAGAP